MFHSTSMQISVEYVSPMTQERKIANKYASFFLGLNDVFVRFCDWNDNSHNHYMGIGTIEKCRIIVQSPILAGDCAHNWKFVGQTHESNLMDGVYVSYENITDGNRYLLNIKKTKPNELVLSEPMKLPMGIDDFALLDGRIYGFAKKANTMDVDLTKIVMVSVENGDYEIVSTTNSDTTFDDCESVRWIVTACVGLVCNEQLVLKDGT
ncbi:hypothetical protein M3Y95_00969200 [Aphelenchoides besseyi]|nr:hypothetical protein M3Y95_00969200 [Aphelenchoides besseyi]